MGSRTLITGELLGPDQAPFQAVKQILQNLKTGAVSVTDVPAPVVRPGFVLVRTAASLISAGTERMTVETGQKSLMGRAFEQPALVKQVIQKARTEGVLNTIDAVRSKLESLVALGYSAAGTVMEVGDGVTEFRQGDRVACAGVGYASHAEVLAVPKNLCVRLPAPVSFDAAAFGTLGAIALQGVRLTEPTLGEAVVVIGLGLIGQLAVQLLKANGCRVFGIDLDEKKIELARQFGADAGCAPDDDAQRRVMEWSRGRGRGCRSDYRRDFVEPAGGTRGRDLAAERPGGRGGRGRTEHSAQALLRSRTHVPDFNVLWSRPLRSGIRRARTRLSRSVTCAGLKAATSKPFLICWLKAASMLSP